MSCHAKIDFDKLLSAPPSPKKSQVIVGRCLGSLVNKGYHGYRELRNEVGTRVSNWREQEAEMVADEPVRGTHSEGYLFDVPCLQDVFLDMDTCKTELYNIHGDRKACLLLEEDTEWQMEKVQRYKNPQDYVPFSKTYVSKGLFIHADEEGGMHFELRNHQDKIGRGWDIFLGSQYKLYLERISFSYNVDVDKTLLYLLPIFQLCGVKYIEIVDVFFSKRLDARFFNIFLTKFRVRGLSFVPMNGDMFGMSSLRSLEVLYSSGKVYPLNDQFLVNAKLQALKADLQEAQVTGEGIKILLTLWLHKKVILHIYDLRVNVTNPRVMWPNVPVRQIRCYGLGNRRGGGNYILKKLFSSNDHNVKLIRRDGAEIRIWLQDAQPKGQRLLLLNRHGSI